MLLLLFNCNNGKKITLVQNNQSEYSIVVEKNASENVQTAAKILKEYIERISDCKLSIQNIVPENNKYINITSCDKADHIDAFSIKTEKGNLFISGGIGDGPIYGVTTFLEKYIGCRKFNPTEEYVPTLESITISSINFSDKPAANFRCVNGQFARDENYRQWRRTHDIPDMFANRYFVHTFNRLVPWEKYFEDHPEYYSFATGKRLKDQLCLSNENVYKIAEAKLIAEMAKQPNEKVWSVSQNDNFTYCRCPECQKIIDEEESPSGPVIRFVNRLARRFPDKVISTLAYQFSRSAPKVTKPEENVQIMLCTIELNRSKPIEFDKGSQSFVRDIQDWSKISNRIFLWDYTVDFHHHVAPFPNLHVLQPNLQFFLRNNAYDLFQQTNTAKGHEFSELKAYLISNLMWNPNVDVDSLKQDFVSHYYGDAAPSITKYMDHLEKALSESDAGMGIYDHPVNMKNTVMSAENTKAYIEYFDKAVESVKDNEIFLQRVKVARLPIQYAIMEIGKNDMFGARGWYKKDNDEYTLNQEMVERLETFYQVSINNNVSNINEMGGTPKTYYNSTKHFIDVQIEGNLAFEKKVICTPAASPKYSEGNAQILTNGVQGAGDYKVHWLGWEAQNFSITLDLEQSENPKSIKINSLYFPKSWILHPKSVKCFTSSDGKSFKEIGFQSIPGDQIKEDEIHCFEFENDNNLRYVKFDINGTMGLPNWHPSAKGKSWVFIDEIVIK